MKRLMTLGQCRGQQTFSGKGQVIHILDFVSHSVSAANTQRCCYGSEVAPDNIIKEGVRRCPQNIIYQNGTDLWADPRVPGRSVMM